MPGGTGYLLPSLFESDYSFERQGQGEPQIGANSMKNRMGQVTNVPPHPPKPITADKSLSNLEETAIQFARHAHVVDLEKREQLLKFCEEYHRLFVYRVEEVVVVALRFSDFRKLMDFSEESNCRLPAYTKFKITYNRDYIKRQTNEKVTRKLEGFIPGIPMGDFKAAAACIIITNKSATDLGDDCISLVKFADDPTLHDRASFKCEVEIQLPETTMKAQILAASQLLAPANQRWWSLIKTKVHNPKGNVDIFTEYIKRISDDDANAAELEKANKAFHSMLERVYLTDEQYNAAYLPKFSIDGVCVIFGPAGTGKSMLADSFAQFSHETGQHGPYLAQANSNVDTMVKSLQSKIPEIRRSCPSFLDLRKHNLLAPHHR